MMAPAIHPSSKPCALPMPKRAIPMVAIVVHELPVITDTNAQIMQVEARKKIRMDNLHTIIYKGRYHPLIIHVPLKAPIINRIMIAVATPEMLLVMASS